jgi:proteasome lid subunit RPN8/RPN11
MDADSARFGTNFNAFGTRVVLTDSIMAGMHAHASFTYPEECCGLLVGSFEDGTKTKRALEAKRMGNVFRKEERFHRYTIDPKEFLVAESEAESHGFEVVGIYHSHPNAPAKPSAFDRDRAWPTLSYVVIEIRDAKPVETKSWVLKEDRSEFEPEGITTAK